jgi:PAS domain S-box-containing protein
MSYFIIRILRKEGYILFQKPTQNNLEKQIRELEKEVFRLKQTEKSLRIELAELDQIFQTVTNGVIVINKNFNVLRINRSFSDLIGVSQQDAVVKKCYQIFPGSFCHTPRCPLLGILEGLELLEYGMEQHRKDYMGVPCKITTRALRGSDGKLIGIVEDLADISVHKQEKVGPQKGLDRFRKTMDGIIQAMSLTIEKRDPYTAGH